MKKKKKKEKEKEKKKKARTQKKKQAGPPRKPVRVTAKKKITVEREEGPRGWFLPVAEETYARLVPRGAPAPPPPPELPESGVSFTSTHVPGAGESVLATVEKSVWLERLREYRQRKSAAILTPLEGPPLAEAPSVPGGRNWLPLGPNVVLDGQTVGSEPVAGRVSGVAVAPGAQIVYVASAVGSGANWAPLQNGLPDAPVFDLQMHPTQRLLRAATYGRGVYELALDP